MIQITLTVALAVGYDGNFEPWYREVQWPAAPSKGDGIIPVSGWSVATVASVTWHDDGSATVRLEGIRVVSTHELASFERDWRAAGWRVRDV